MIGHLVKAGNKEKEYLGIRVDYSVVRRTSLELLAMALYFFLCSTIALIISAITKLCTPHAPEVEVIPDPNIHLLSCVGGDHLTGFPKNPLNLLLQALQLVEIAQLPGDAAGPGGVQLQLPIHLQRGLLRILEHLLYGNYMMEYKSRCSLQITGGLCRRGRGSGRAAGRLEGCRLKEMGPIARR